MGATSRGCRVLPEPARTLHGRPAPCPVRKDQKPLYTCGQVRRAQEGMGAVGWRVATKKRPPEIALQSARPRSSGAPGSSSLLAVRSALTMLRVFFFFLPPSPHTPSC